MSSKRRIFCNRCETNTWHALRGEHRQSYHPEEYEEMQIDFAEGAWQIWQCQGCEEVVFLETWITSEDYDAATGVPKPSEHFYPERSRHSVKKKHYRQIPNELDSIYGEVVTAFNSGCYVLCAAGLRALLEGICKNKGISSGLTSRGTTNKTLEGKINGLKSYVPENIVENLHGFRFLGNQALHELEKPSKDDLALAIEVIEDILNVVYELDYKSGRLFKRVSSHGTSPNTA
jgi:hypothetical protein